MRRLRLRNRSAGSAPADVGGWTVPVPTPADTTTYSRLHLLQPGTRLIYIASSGTDSTDKAVASFYLWDGANIIDTAGSAIGVGGVAYGTDPMNPTGPIKPYATWNYCGPDLNGGEIGSGATGVGRTTFLESPPLPANRLKFPDWWLFKRGDTFDLAAQFPGGGANQSLAVPGGASAVQVVGAYGATTVARPRFTHPGGGFVSRSFSAGLISLKNVLYQSLHFDGHDRGAGVTFAAATLLNHDTDTLNVVFEDVWSDGCAEWNVQHSGSTELRRCLIGDHFTLGTEHVQGMFNGGKGYTAVLKLIDCIWYRNGFHADPSLSWPPSGGAVDWDTFSRNMYLSGLADHANSECTNNVSLLGGSGDQFRLGMKVEGNFFYNGYVTLNGHGGDLGQANSGTLKDNVQQCFRATLGTTAAHPSWGFLVGHGAHNVDMSGNISTRAQCGRTTADTSSWGLWFKVINDDTISPLLDQLRNNVATGNIFDCGVQAWGVETDDGTTEPLYGWTNPGVANNEAKSNVFAYAGSTLYHYVSTNGASGDNTYVPTTGADMNRTYSTMAAAKAGEGWADADRTLKTYLDSIGVSVASSDGVTEYVALMQSMRRGQWRPDLTAKAIVNHIRGGFNMATLP